MNKFFSVFFIVAIASFSSKTDAASLPSATALQNSCKAALPDVPLLISGELQAKSPEGDLEQKLNLEMILDWKAVPASARFTIRDNFGETQEHLSVTWPTDGSAEYRYFQGNPLTAARLPPLDAPVQKTDISWLDLSLSYLWWTNSETIDAEEIKGRPCYIIDTYPPQNSATTCQKIRAWIDPKINLMLKAETYDSTGNLARNLEVKSFKKIKDRWVIQNIEIESLPSRHKTMWRVRDVQQTNRLNYLPTDTSSKSVDENIDVLHIPAQ